MGKTKGVNDAMFKIFKQISTNFIKSPIYSPVIKYQIIFREGALNDIKRVKGWKTDTQVASALGFTRQYICNLKKGRAACSADVITRIAASVGNVDQNWWSFYHLIPTGIIQSNEPQYNEAKYLGQVPYEKYSSSAEIRSQDGPVEVKK